MTRILFVDDDPAILQALRNSFRKERDRWTMVFALGGRSALAELAQGEFDVVVSDLYMPDVDGTALLAYVRDHHPHTVRMLLSGSRQPTDPTIAQFLFDKPFDAHALRQVIAAATLPH